jgi:protein-S-isoprenylcysteine O-methyltransferase Ste14
MPTAPRLEHAGVSFPPPFVYAAAFLIGVVINRWHPLAITAASGSPAFVRLAVAAVAFLVWIAFFAGALTAFRRAGTTLIPNRPATAFVERGPYRFSRNPMYVSLVALYAGLALWVNTWWPLTLLPAVIIVIQFAVIAREERYLASAFPEPYAAYCKRVRRWL